jgi:hypothetical protein
LLVDAIYKKRRDKSEFCSIVHDIVIFIMSSFLNFAVKFVRKQTNLIVHALARSLGQLNF